MVGRPRLRSQEGDPIERNVSKTEFKELVEAKRAEEETESPRSKKRSKKRKS